jgi:hypothetical protein
MQTLSQTSLNIHRSNYETKDSVEQYLVRFRYAIESAKRRNDTAKLAELKAEWQSVKPYLDME